MCPLLAVEFTCASDAVTAGRCGLPARCDGSGWPIRSIAGEACHLVASAAFWTSTNGGPDERAARSRRRLGPRRSLRWRSTHRHWPVHCARFGGPIAQSGSSCGAPSPDSAAIAVVSVRDDRGASFLMPPSHSRGSDGRSGSRRSRDRSWSRMPYWRRRSLTRNVCANVANG